MDYKKNPPPPSLELLSLRGVKKVREGSFCVTGVPTTYLS
jgi:hypothetical protein